MKTMSAFHLYVFLLLIKWPHILAEWPTCLHLMTNEESWERLHRTNKSWEPPAAAISNEIPVSGTPNNRKHSIFQFSCTSKKNVMK